MFRLNSAIPVLRVGDYPKAKEFWTQVLGFRVTEEGGDPPQFGIFWRDEIRVFVDAWQGADVEPSPGWRAYFHCDDVDALHADVKAAGAEISDPVDTVYGMREVVITDPWGSRLCFGRAID